ncbi:MAG: thioredoxin [Bacteroidota bacterium]|jgi:thioredoxin 1
MAFEITDSNFKTEVLDKEGVAVLDFWAEWCGPCRMIAPIIDKLSEEYKGKALIGKVNVDNNPDITVKYGIRSIPTILVFKNGEVVNRHVGVTTQGNLAQMIDAQMA